MSTLTNHDFSLLLALSRYIERNTMQVVYTARHCQPINDLVFTVLVSVDGQDSVSFESYATLIEGMHGAYAVGDAIKPFFISALARTYNKGYMRAHALTELFNHMHSNNPAQHYRDRGIVLRAHPLHELTFVHADRCVCVTATGVRVDDVLHTHEQLTALAQ